MVKTGGWSRIGKSWAFSMKEQPGWERESGWKVITRACSQFGEISSETLGSNWP